jgi:NTP pyrophosphatase (non-canonical NTP hydrolase)
MNKTIKEAQEFVKNFSEDRNWQRPPTEVLIHLMEELGEVARNVLNMKNYGGKHDTNAKENMEEELGDVLWLLLKLSNEVKIDLEKSFEKVIEKNSEKYPLNK